MKTRPAESGVSVVEVVDGVTVADDVVVIGVVVVLDDVVVIGVVVVVDVVVEVALLDFDERSTLKLVRKCDMEAGLSVFVLKWQEKKITKMFKMTKTDFESLITSI